MPAELPHLVFGQDLADFADRLSTFFCNGGVMFSRIVVFVFNLGFQGYHDWNWVFGGGGFNKVQGVNLVAIGAVITVKCSNDGTALGMTFECCQ